MFRRILLLTVLLLTTLSAQIPGLHGSPYFDEQTITFRYEPEIRVHINAPSVAQFDPAKATGLALYALPNGNTIEQTVGKVMEAGDDWHFDIQHIGAQNRFLRNHVDEYNLVTIYLETDQKSWPAWKAAHADHAEIIQQLVSYLTGIFAAYDPFIVLTGHSGGGRFTFSFLDGVSEIPASVKRISFLDSNYGYEHYYGDKIIAWLNASDDHYLSVIAYNDSVALYNGSPIVSATGGTWYRSRIMKKYMANYFTFTDSEDADFIRYTALGGRVKFILKQNPNRIILHTVQVERNGHIQGMVSGTGHEAVDYTYYGERAYSEWIQQNTAQPAELQIPPRPVNARSGSQFMSDVTNLSFEAREVQILAEISAGNIPDFMRQLTTISTSFQDNSGVSHTVSYQVMPDYLAIGSDDDFCRIPMGPKTAQKIADLFGAVMPTRKLVDNIYINCAVKLQPVAYAPVGNQNELVPKFIEHNTDIEALRLAAGGQLGQLTGGTKKDVVLSNLIIDPARLNRVVIYGWHQLNGSPIQPLTNIHYDTYVDYSHGIRLLNGEFLLDGEVTAITDILSNPGLYKILSDESGVMVQPTYIPDTALPAKPKSFGVRGAGPGSVEVLIGDAGTAWRVTSGTDPNNMQVGSEYSANSFILDGLPDGQTCYVQLQAVNTAGASAPSEKLAAVAGEPSSGRVLIVNGFDRASTGNTFDFIRHHGKAVLTAGYAFDSASNDAVIDGLFALNDYAVADYILGDESTADETFSDAEQALVANYLKQGGSLLASGSEIAWDLDYRGSTTDKSFLRNYLKVQYVADAPGGLAGTYYSVTPLDNGIFDGMPGFSFDNGTHGTIDVDYPDVYAAVNGGFGNLRYSAFDASYGYAGVNYHGYFPGGTQTGSVVTLAMPLETIYPEAVRLNVMAEILNYFATATNLSAGNSPLPNDFRLAQNYPNPFNPLTTIEFSLPKAARVSLRVFDLLGRETAVLGNGTFPAGIHSVQFDGSNLASGEYIYQLNAGNEFVTQRRMLLVK